MKVLYLRTVFWFGIKSGGSVGHTAGVINTLSKRVKVDIISNDTLPGVISKITIIPPGFSIMIPFGLGELLYSCKLIKTLKKRLADYHNIYQRYSGFSFAGAYLSRHNDIPLILEFNGSDVWVIKHWFKQPVLIKTFLAWIINKIRLPIVSYIEEYNLKNAALIIVVSASLKEFLMQKKIPEQKILVNPNGADPEKYSPSISGTVIRKKYGLKNHKVIGFVGTFGPWHGVVEMARSIELFFKLNPIKIKEIKFLLIGDGKLMPLVKNILNRKPYIDNVIFTGLIPQDEGPQYLAACDILLSPHIKNPDGSKFFGSPTKLFEYMAMGKAIIASDLDQIGSILEHKKTAYLVEPGNIKQLADAMQLLIEDPKLSKELGENARAEVLKKYTWEKHVGKILAKLNTMEH